MHRTDALAFVYQKRPGTWTFAVDTGSRTWHGALYNSQPDAFREARSVVTAIRFGIVPITITVGMPPTLLWEGDYA